MKRGATSHPKMLDLREKLGIGLAAAVGTIELLIHFTAVYAPQGDIGRYSDKRIAAAVDWHKAPAKLIEALAETGWIDPHPGYRWLLHDWSDHCDRTTSQKLSRSGKKPIQLNEEDSDKLCTRSEPIGTIPDHPPVSVSSSGFSSGTHTHMSAPRLVEKAKELPIEDLPKLPSAYSKIRTLPSASDLDGQPCLEQFEAVWERWPAKVGRDQSASNWLSYVTDRNVDKVMACVDRYLASGEVKRGVTKRLFNWLAEQHQDRWEGVWQLPVRAEDRWGVKEDLWA